MKTKELKALVEIKDGKMVAVASTEDVDRVGESLDVKDWDFKNFKKNPVLQAGHDYKPQFTIGIAKKIVVEGTKVIFEPVFHNVTQLAREIGEMYQQGYLKAFSVGFIPGGSEKKKKNELLEISAVAVPANPHALVISKDLDEEKVKEIENWVGKESSEKETEDKKVKSPACRMEGETEKECVARKIPELIKEGRTQDEAVAIAISMCGKACKKETEEIETKVGRVLSTKNRKIVSEALEVIKKAGIALEELLAATETPEPEKEQVAEEIKEIVKKVEPMQIDDKQVIIKAIQKIAKNVNFVLSKIK